MLLAVVAGSVLGLLRGFVKETMALAAWIAAIAAVRVGHGRLTTALSETVGTASGAAVLAFVLLFSVVFLAVRLGGDALGRRTRASLLGPFDRALGLGFGALKGLVIATLAFLFAGMVYNTVYGYRTDRPLWMTESRTYPLLRACSAAIVTIVAKRREQ